MRVEQEADAEGTAHRCVSSFQSSQVCVTGCPYGKNDIDSCFLANRGGTTLRTIVILAYQGAQLLDLTGPASVFWEVAEFVPEPPYEIILASAAGGVVATSSGVALETVSLMTILPDDIDTFVVPGGTAEGLRGLLRDRAICKSAMVAAAQARRVASICTGAFALASWGLLDGRRSATHWEAAAELARRFPAVRVDADALYVEDGRVWTSAGVSTGIDMALALVERDLGREISLRVARRLVLPMRRPGHQSQFSAVLEAQGGAYAELAAWMSDNLAADLTLEALAGRAGQTPRTFHRRFSAQTGMTPAAFVERLRLDRARTLLEAGQTPKRVSAVVGFTSLDRLGRVFRRVYALTPSAYRALHAG